MELCDVAVVLVGIVAGEDHPGEFLVLANARSIESCCRVRHRGDGVHTRNVLCRAKGGVSIRARCRAHILMNVVLMGLAFALGRCWLLCSAGGQLVAARCFLQITAE